MTITPLRNQVLVRLQKGMTSTSSLMVIEPEQTICRFLVVACGSDVRDVKPEQIVLANRLAGTIIGSELLLPESAILAFVEPAPLPYVVKKIPMPWVIDKRCF